MISKANATVSKCWCPNTIRTIMVTFYGQNRLKRPISEYSCIVRACTSPYGIWGTKHLPKEVIVPSYMRIIIAQTITSALYWLPWWTAFYNWRWYLSFLNAYKKVLARIYLEQILYFSYFIIKLNLYTLKRRIYITLKKLHICIHTYMYFLNIYTYI